jgi:hypothetical protein
MTEVSWKPMPAEYREAMEPFITNNLHLVPGWCRTLTMEYLTAGDADAYAACSVDFEYRQATIRLFPMLLDLDACERERTAAHELLHIALNPLSDWSRSLIERLVQDVSLREHLVEDVTGRMEGVVQDLMFSLVPRTEEKHARTKLAPRVVGRR